MSNSDTNSGAQPAGGWEGETPVFSEWMVILPIYIHFMLITKAPELVIICAEIEIIIL